MNFERAEKYRKKIIPYVSKPGDPFGYFKIANKHGIMVVLADNGETTGWEHASVSYINRTPSWDDMIFVKNLFWNEDETVVQFHPRKSEYVNCHPHCLHLWKKVDSVIELPPTYLIGPKRNEL